MANSCPHWWPSKRPTPSLSIHQGWPSGRPRCRYLAHTDHPEDTPLKTEREDMDMIAAFNDVGSYRGAAVICGVDHKTVKRALGRSAGREARAHNYDIVADVVAKKVAATSARISAKRRLPVAQAAGYEGSARNFRPLQS
jgi:hypothetical protein